MPISPSAALRCVALCLLVALPGTAAAQYGYHFGRNKVQYEDFEWSVLRTEHFDVYFYAEAQELAEHGAFFAEEIYDELQNRFGFSITRRVPLIFYSSNLHFKQTNTTPGFIPDGVGGFFEFLKGRVVIPANGDLNRFRRVVRHELVHVFTYNKVIRVLRDHRVPPERFLPLWFTEGIAEYWSGAPDHQHEMVMRDAMFANYLVPLENMYRISGSYLMYKQGEAICRFISETYGEERLLEIMEATWIDKDFRVVLEYVLKDDFDVIAARWKQWLKDQYYPSAETLEPARVVAASVATEGFSAKPAVYTHRDGTRRVYYVGNRTGYSNVFAVEVDSSMRPVAAPEVVVRGERSEQFEAFHLFESRISISSSGRLAFVTQSGGRDVIHLYDLEQEQLGPTLHFEALTAVYSPTWSPDGGRLAFAAIDDSGYSDLYTYALGDGTLRRLTRDAYHDADPAWDPQGDRIAFASNRTPYGKDGAANLFLFDMETGRIDYATFGRSIDQSPRWTPDGEHIVFTRTRPDSTGRWSAQDVWMVDAPNGGGAPALASLEGVPDAEGPRMAARLTALPAAAYDPVWTADGHLVFASFEDMRFSIRALDGDSLAGAPRDLVPEREPALAALGEAHWAHGRLGAHDGVERVPYRRAYKLDFAEGQVSQSPVLGTSGGAVISFSDMLGDDHLVFTLYNVAQEERNPLKSLSFSLGRYQLQRRANVGYGLYRFAGRRYDRGDPDAVNGGFPLVYETIYGGFGSVSYPISKFRRIEVGTSLNWSDKTAGVRQREALLLSNAVSLVHDNALYSMNGPVDGWRANLTTAYTTDVLYSNVSYLSLSADVRHYLRLGSSVTFASRGLMRFNEGREARLWLLGGSWDLRGFRFFDVRGEKLWFTSHELRFPLLIAPYLYMPLLAPLGVANVRGALFVDAAHAWNDDYHERDARLRTGETLGAVGGGLRLNLFGAFVLRYDVGYRYRDGFRERDRFFKQFFFGWDF